MRELRPGAHAAGPAVREGDLRAVVAAVPRFLPPPRPVPLAPHLPRRPPHPYLIDRSVHLTPRIGGRTIPTPAAGAWTSKVVPPTGAAPVAEPVEVSLSVASGA
jgi:hypothetical protein